ncbi:MAG: ABC transporter ATP-binding protein [Candidatus Schekmanbacteria bacterium]|nr:ABC transporter ATP-binding protein [Candidatus Schekmanbacteria bacterium]
MNNNIAVEAKGLGIKFTLNHKIKQRSGTVRTLVLNMLRSNDKKEDFWALRDVNLTIKKGEIISIIGKNGAGKSTLLKMIAGTLIPDEGSIRTEGVISALLELGAGFRSELTGRENIFLNGAILGLKLSTIRERFDSIVEFAELQKFLDLQVKNYSSGMRARLGFSIAAHVDADILIIDEVLAVGDAAFREKCKIKISEFISMGKTIVIVSHDMSMVTKFSTSALWIENGFIKASGDANKIIEEYLRCTV